MTSPLHAATASKPQLAWATAITAGVLLVLGLWTQSRLGDRLLPHAFCISASQPLLLLHLVSDGLIAFAYLAIPWTILNFVRRRGDVPFGWIAWVFGAFIVACGVTHAMQVWTLWYPVYWYAGVAKAFTAAVSLGTAWLLYRLTPAALALPSAEQLRTANATLEREVAARRRAEAELAEAHRQLARRERETSAVLDRFFDEAPMGLALIAQDGRMLRVNAGFSAETGRPLPDYAARRMQDLPGIPAQVLEGLQAIGAGASTRREFDATGVRNGTDRTWRCTLFHIPVEGSPPMVGAVVQDITAQRQLEAERAAAMASLQEADRRKDEFIAVLAHELRNPLAPIDTAAQVLTSAAPAGPTVERMAGVIDRQVRAMSRLLEDLLDVSRIVLGRMDLRPAPVDLGQGARQVAEDHRDTFASQGTQLQVDIADGALPVEGDAVRLAQAIGNYLHNAGKFAAGCHVRVSAFADARTGEAVVRVEDDGPGLDDKLAAQVFEPFTQGKQDMARTKGGLGLGLALARGIAERHGGQVATVPSRFGRGAGFELRIPLRRDA